MELKFKNSSMMCFQIVQIDQESKKYVMDTSTISPKRYYWGFKTDTITNGIVSLFFFMFTLGSFPIAHPYKHGQVEVEKIEKF